MGEFLPEVLNRESGTLGKAPRLRRTQRHDSTKEIAFLAYPVTDVTRARKF